MANPVQTFIDSGSGLVIATAFHTLGAIGLLGGVVGYIAWHRHLRVGHHHSRLLSVSAAVTYLSIFVNLVGGFMRTWEAGHPSLTKFMDSPWVRAISLKHAFLFAGMAAAIYLFEVAAPRQLKAQREDRLDGLSLTGHSVAVFLVLMGILMAGVLGAVSRVTPFAQASASEAGPQPPEAGLVVRYENDTGQLTSTPAAPATSTGAFEVPTGALSIDASLTWDPSQFDLTLTLTDPSGNPMDFPGMGGAVEATLDSPQAGDWSYSVSSGFALNAQWRLSIEVTSAEEGVLSDTVTVAPGDFYEINTQMPMDGSLHWNWTASGHLRFNVHSHFDGEVQDWVDMHAEGDSGTYTNERAGGYSFFWENTGTADVALDYLVWGDFELDSIHG